VQEKSKTKEVGRGGGGEGGGLSKGERKKKE